MSTIKRVAKNTVASLLIRVSTPLFTSILFFYIARIMGAEELGKYSSPIALLLIFQAFAAAGFPYFITKEIAQDHSNSMKFITNGSLLSIAISIIMVIAMNITAFLVFGPGDLFNYSVILSFSLLPYGLYQLYQSVFRGIERLDLIAVSIMSGNMLKLIAGIIVLAYTQELFPLMIVISGSHIIILIFSMLFMFLNMKKGVKEYFHFDVAFCVYIIKSLPIYAIILSLGTLRITVSTLILNSMMGETEVGLYNSSYKLVNLLSFGITAYIMAVQPMIFRLFSVSRDKFEDVILKSIRYFCILLFPIIGGIIILSPEIIQVVYAKPEFDPAAVSLSISVWMLLLFGLNQIFANTVIAAKKQSMNMWANVLGTVTLFLFNYIFIRLFNFVGAAMADIASTFLTMVVQYIYINMTIVRIKILRYTLKPLVASVLMCGLIFLIRDLNIFLIIPICMVVYTLLILALKGVEKEDMVLIKDVMARKADKRK